MLDKPTVVRLLAVFAVLTVLTLAARGIGRLTGVSAGNLGYAVGTALPYVIVIGVFVAVLFAAGWFIDRAIFRRRR